MKDIDDATRRNAAVIELQEQILGAQAAQTTLIENIRKLEEQIADLEAWSAKQKRYELYEWESGSFSYRLKEGMEPAEVAHHACTNCFEQSTISIFQPNDNENMYRRFLRCARCKLEIDIGPKSPGPNPYVGRVSRG